MPNQMRCRFIHSPCVARRAHAPPFAGKRDDKIMPTIVTASYCEAIRKHATFQVLAKDQLTLRLAICAGNTSFELDQMDKPLA